MSEKARFLQLVRVDSTQDEFIVCKAAFRAILGGGAPDRAELATATGFSPEEVGVLLAGLAQRGLVSIEPDSGSVVGCWGLSLLPTDHELRLRNRELYTWCAVDAVGIPAGLGEDASIASHCSRCGGKVSVEMVAGQVRHVEPADVQVWLTAGRGGRSVVGFT